MTQLKLIVTQRLLILLLPMKMIRKSSYYCCYSCLWRSLGNEAHRLDTKTRNRLRMQLQLLLMLLLPMKMIGKSQLLLMLLLPMNIYKLLSRTWMFILEKDMSLQLQLLLMLLLPLKMIKKRSYLRYDCVYYQWWMWIYINCKQSLNVHIIEGHHIFISWKD